MVMRRQAQILRLYAELVESALGESGASKDRHTTNRTLTSGIEVGREKRINDSRRRR